MNTPSTRTLAAALLAFGVFAAGLASAALSGAARAEPQPAIDRGLVERLVRAEEQQVKELERLTRATERAAERCGPPLSRPQAWRASLRG